MTLHETTITENLYTFFNTASENEKREVFKLLYKEDRTISDKVFNNILLFNEQGDFPGKSRDEKGLPDLVFWGSKTLVFVEVKIDINTSTTNMQDGNDYDSYEKMLETKKDLYNNRKLIYLVPKLYRSEIKQSDIVKVVYWEDFIKYIHAYKINNPILNLIIDQLKLKEIYPDNMLLNKQEAVTFLSGTDELQKVYDIFEGNKRYKPIEIKTLGIDFHHYYEYKNDKKFGIGLYPYETDVVYGISLYAEYSDGFMKKLNDYGLTKDKFKIDQEYVDNDWKYYIYFPLNYENDKDAILSRAEKIINRLNGVDNISDFSQHCSVPFIDIAKVRSE